jgi:uncharacterized protein YecE (DUF72 family)
VHEPGTPLRPVRVGCSGWNYRSWKERGFYPPKLPASRWLEHYAATFDTVEVNSTFYRLASRDAVARWVQQTPPDFVFALKASRYLTHFKRMTDMDEGIRRYCERIEPLLGTPKLGPILWQLPERFTRDDERLAGALDALRSFPAARHCVEFRHPSWFTAEVYELLRRHGVALAIGDTATRPFQAYEFTTDWTLLRFHFGRRGRRGNYSPAELDAWARRIHGWRRDVEVLAYFNNDWEMFAPRNALALRGALERLQAAGSRPTPALRGRE